ncbi:Asr3 protein [Scheffersomyces amazonensis]|uniref:Asr3 protein n=1 Tax=Scheffersomyces amazonensis TaxID=1078765 RepID=UPI00315CD084
MNPLLFNTLIFVCLYLSYRLIFSSSDNHIVMAKNTSSSSEQSLFNKFTPEELENLDPDKLLVDMHGKRVPFSKISKPHHVVLDPARFKPQVNAETFPDIEPAAKEREAQLAAAREAKQAAKDEDSHDSK